MKLVLIRMKPCINVRKHNEAASKSVRTLLRKPCRMVVSGRAMQTEGRARGVGDEIG